MAENIASTSSQASPKAGRRWFRSLGITAGATLCLLVALYLVVTSGAFIKGFILPRVGRALQARLTAEDCSLSPFSQVVVRGLKLETAGSEPVFQAEELRAQYSLLAILRGDIKVREVALVSPKVFVLQQADGKSNLDPLLRLGSEAPKAPAPAEESKPIRLEVAKVTLSRGTLRFVRQMTNGAEQVSEVRSLELAVENLGSAQTGKVSLGLELDQANRPGPKSTNQADTLKAKLSGSFDLALDTKLFPSGVKGELRFGVEQAQGQFQDFRGMAASLICDLSGAELRQLALRFQRGGQNLGELRVSGPLDAAKREARLKLDLRGVDRNVLNLFGAPRGLDFGESTLNAETWVDLSRKGQLITAKGKVGAGRLAVRQGGLTTPPTDLELSYQATANLQDQTAILHQLSLAAKQRQAEWFSAVLDRPMNLAWGENVHGLNEATVKVDLKELNLQDWRAFLGANAPAGKLMLQATLASKQDGQQLRLDLAAQARDLAVAVLTNRLDQGRIDLRMSSQLTDFKSFLLDQFSLQVARRDATLLSASGSAGYDLKSQDANLQVSLETELASLRQVVPLEAVDIGGGKVTLNSNYTKQKDRQSATVRLALADFRGQLADYRLRDFHANLEADAEIKGDQVTLRRGTLALQQGLEPGGNLDLGGDFNLATKEGNVRFNLVNLNQSVLAPALVPVLASNTLSSAALNLNGTARYSPTGDTSLELTADLTKVVVIDPAGKLPKTPLNARLQVDAVRQPSWLNVRKLALSLTPGSPGQNEVQLQSKVNLTNKVAEFSFTIAEVNEQGLGPLLAPALAPNSLASISLNGKGSGRYDPNGEGAIQMGLDLTRLVITHPEQKLPPTPWTAQFQLESAQQRSRIELRKLALALPPTPRGTNRLQMQGSFDLASNNAAPSRLSLTAESLDLTPFYDLFMTNRVAASGKGKAPAPTNQVKRAEAKAPASSPPAEPGPIQLPLQQFTADLRVDKLYLRELAVSNWVATLAINQGDVTLKPCRLALNGAPISLEGKVNVAQPGFVYDLNLQANDVALEPIANTFAPEQREQFKGRLFAQAQVQGAGITGAGLEKNLKGLINFNLTNINLQVAGPKMQKLLTPVALLLRLPELRETALNYLSGDATLGGGQVQLNRLVAASPALIATVHGAVKLAEVLTNSPLDLPVQLALPRHLAEQARVMPGNAPPDARFVTLPQFVTVKGTVGDPRTETDKAKLGGQLLDTAGQLVGGKEGNLLRNVGGLLKGDRPAATNQVAAPAGAKTNAPPKPGLLNLLPGLLPPRK